MACLSLWKLLFRITLEYRNKETRVHLVLYLVKDSVEEEEILDREDHDSLKNYQYLITANFTVAIYSKNLGQTN